MTYAQRRFATKEPTCCAVCRRHAIWLGYSPKQNDSIIWLCANSECHELGKQIYKMPVETLDAYEIGAAREAIDVAGPYLDEIGTTDLAALDHQQMGEFLRRFIVGYEQSMRRKILEGEAPF